MKCNYVILILLVCTVLAATTPVSAHPPSIVQLSYDYPAGTLHVTIHHQVADPADHYVKEVVVTGLNREDSSWKYTSQPDNSEFSYAYPVSVKKGDTIVVSAECNKYGILEGRMTAQSDGTPSGSLPDTSVPAGLLAQPRADTPVPSAPGITPYGVVVILILTGLYTSSVRKNDR